LLGCESEPPAPLPTANFYVDNAGCLTSCYVYFYDQSINAVRWEWSFGNTLSSDQPDDSTQYHNPGFYDVTLKVWNADNVEDKITKQVTVY
jgi:PKD repeat protein